MPGFVRTIWSQVTARHVRDALIQFVVFAAYFLSGKLGLSLAYINPSATAVWAPAGISLAAFLMLGPRRAWPPVILAAFLVNVTTAGNIFTSTAIAIGNTLDAALGAYLITRFAAGRDAFRSSNTVFRFTAIIALCSAPVSATVGVVALAIAGMAPWTSFAHIWMTWWLGNLSGVLVVTPLIILWSAGPFRRRWTEVAEALALLLLLVPTGMLVFGDLLGAKDKQYPLEFMCVPLFLWPAFRLGRREAVSAVGVLSVIAVWGSYRGYGPFVRPSPNESFLILQSYTAMWAVVSMALAAVVSEHRQSAELSRALAITDPLTGLANFRRLNEVLTAEIARSSRTGRPFALLFLDLNGLKKINDRYGHLAGNQALRRVADALRKSCRTTDTPARFGGDEFVAILPETDEAGGQVVARRVADRVASDLTAKPPLSVSTGIAVYPRDGMTPAMMLAAADSLLYQVKVARPGPRRRVAGGGR
jgi:diguanylate cyclase (GGDEF)-like protein